MLNFNWNITAEEVYSYDEEAERLMSDEEFLRGLYEDEIRKQVMDELHEDADYQKWLEEITTYEEEEREIF